VASIIINRGVPRLAYPTTTRILSWLAPIARSTATKDKRGRAGLLPNSYLTPD
jgi:hypothetical protein